MQNKTKIEDNLIPERVNEMGSSGRTSLYQTLESYLPPDRLRAFKLVNHGLAILDDTIDRGVNPEEHLAKAKVTLKQSFTGNPQTPRDEEEKIIIELGSALRSLKKGFFQQYSIGVLVYNEVQKFWDIETRNFQRRWRVLRQTELDDLTREIGKSVALQFCYLLDPGLNYYERESLSNEVGFAVKLADNLVDLKEDILAGFINIPKEEIHNVRGVRVENDNVVAVDKGSLRVSRDYTQREYQRVNQAYHSADYFFIPSILKRPIWRRELSLFREIIYSWFRDIKKAA